MTSHSNLLGVNLPKADVPCPNNMFFFVQASLLSKSLCQVECSILRLQMVRVSIFRVSAFLPRATSMLSCVGMLSGPSAVWAPSPYLFVLLHHRPSFSPLTMDADVESHPADSVDIEVNLMMQQGAAAAEIGGGKSRGKGGKGRPRKRGCDQVDGDENGEQQAVAKPVAKKRAKGGVQSCKGCKRKVPAEEQAANFPGCCPCKRALDNIAKLASRQGEKAVAFVKEQREDPEKCYAMVQSYCQLCPESCGHSTSKNKKRGSWSVVKYQERIVAASGFVRDKVGEMMPKKLYIEFAMTQRGGRKTDDQAAAQWADWEARAEANDPDIFFDHQGENGSLRIWVHTADEMRFRSSYFQEKAVEMEGESQKNATAADVDRMKNKVTSKHDPIADQIQVCQALARNGEAAFQNNDGFLLDVMDLAAAAAKAETPAPSAQGVKEEVEESPSPEKTVKPWVDRDRAISAAVRSAESQITAFKTKCLKGLKDSKASLEEYKANQDDSFQKNPLEHLPLSWSCPQLIRSRLSLLAFFQCVLSLGLPIFGLQH